MRRAFTVLLLACATFAPSLPAQDARVPRAGMVITQSITFAAGVSRLAALVASDSALAASPLIIIRGNDITVDFAGHQLVGSSEMDAPSQAAGLAILVDGGSNVTIKGAKIRGYKVAILARGTRNLRLLDNVLSFNWKPRLYSIVEHESLADWLSYHQNDSNQWLRYGAAIYLDGVRGGEMRGNTVHQGMNGLLMTRSDSLLVWNNDFSFNSGLGIGLYRSDHNRIMHNRVDYNVRGYSEGFYRRGQDSAGILIYEQSDSNTVAFNSATHSGDGLFLWAGQHTMDTGQGGANDNLFYDNDFSWAPTNGMEATFSRNVFMFNKVVGSDYGLWAGYSYGSVVMGNHFAGNRVGLAIEHGQDNRILANSFMGDTTAIQLWANPIQPSDWGYPKNRDTRSRDAEIVGNSIWGSRVAFRISQTTGITSRLNRVRADTLLATRDTNTVTIDTVPYVGSSSETYDNVGPEVVPLPGATPVLPSEHADKPRSTIIVDEWGPFDWRSPKLWPADSSLATPLRLRVLGPRAGTWRLISASGATVSKRSGRMLDTILIAPLPGPIEDWTITLEYTGAATRSPTGETRGANVPYRFSYSRFSPKALWDVKVFAFTDSTHPLKVPMAFQSLLRGERGERGERGAPALTQTSARLDYIWFRPRIAGWPQDHYGVSATTTVDLPAGTYTLRTISDDGIRVLVDDRVVLEDWSVHESKVREVPLTSGRHRIRVEYFQIDGWAELRGEILRAAPNVLAR